ncbi:hypothetical protein [Brevibacterium sp. HMSC22B09]|uniref:hypothetical protein n=1 Tax=Brevibacterium sp. HMSC22B09 TaxID=1581055 RepID=UPI0008A606BA|nr:hypothetical protein [Brevibacterium sp. HMSC22B09]OFT96804.1 hypothetical protein HMPREF3087_07005 [Brevibacterium sp. HMSC22B09]
MRTTKVRTVIAAAAVAASLGLTGCSVDFNTGSDDKKETSEQSEQTDSSGSSDSGSGEAASQNGDADSGDAEDSGSGSEAVEQGDALGSAEVPVEVDGDKNAKLKVRLISVKRNQQTVEAVYGFTLETTMDDQKSLFTVRGSGFRPYAVDTKNFNKHKAIDELTDVTDTKLSPGRESQAKAAFGAPPEDVDTMDIFLWEGEPLVKGVKIQ